VNWIELAQNPRQDSVGVEHCCSDTRNLGFIFYLGFVGDSILDCQPCDAMTTVHPECFPIPVPEDDPYFPKVNITTGKPMCIPVTRSMPGQLTLGKLSYLSKQQQ
jgi:hypothetical protein